MAVLFLAGCFQSGPGVDGVRTTGPSHTFDQNVDCTSFESVAEATPCVGTLDPDGGADLEVSLAAHPTDASTILLSWTSRTGGNAVVYAALTQDSGESWNVTLMRHPGLIEDPPTSERYAFDSIAAFDRHGRALVFYGGESQRIGPAVDAYHRMTLASTTDGGTTWEYSLVTEDPGAFLWDAMDFAASPDSDDMYAVAQSVSVRGTWFWRSTDAGKTWSDPEPLTILGPDGYAYWPRVATGPDGLVVVTMKTIAQAPLMAVVSQDGGSTFGEPVSLLPSTREGVLIGDPTYVSPVDGRITITPAVSGGLDLVSSTDRGSTWTSPEPLVSSPEGTSPRWAMAAGDGHGRMHSLYSMSGEGIWGIDLVSWRDSDDVVVTRLAPDGTRVPRNGAAGDEYGGLAVAADGSVWAAWSDTRFGSTEVIAYTHLVSEDGIS